MAGRTDGVAFWLAETPVTQRQFAVWTPSNSYTAWRRQQLEDEAHTSRFGDLDAPAVNMAWFEARAYCEWLATRPWHQASGLALLGVDVAFDLPTEVEWEYGCRAGTTTESVETSDG